MGRKSQTQKCSVEKMTEETLLKELIKYESVKIVEYNSIIDEFA